MIPGGPLIRPACNEDVPSLAEIDALAYERERRQGRIAGLVATNSGPTGHVLVVCVDGIVRGFLAYQQVLDGATLLDVAVQPDAQGRGLASALMQAAMGEMRAGALKRCELEVRASNHRAIALYRSCGFTQDGLRAKYYPAEDGREDALLMSVTF